MFEGLTVADAFGGDAVDLVDVHQGEVFLALEGRTHAALYDIAGLQPPLLDLLLADIDIVRAGEIVVIAAAEEAPAFGGDLEDALGLHLVAEVIGCCGGLFVGLFLVALLAAACGIGEVVEVFRLCDCGL